MARTKPIVILILVLVMVSAVSSMVVGKEKILYDVPYRNQVLDFPNWSQNWASCGYTSTLMNLLYCEALPPEMTEQSLIESMYANCSTTTKDGSVIFYYEKMDEFCEQYLPQADLEVSFIRKDFETEIKKALDNEQPVICGTYIFGDVGHVILIVGYDDQNWIVHDPANDWGKEYWPPQGIAWKNAAFVRFPIGGFTYLYGVSIFSNKNKEFAAQMIEQSPTLVLDNEGEMKMVWVKLLNKGTKDWEKDKIHLGTYQPIDRNCGLIAKNSPEKYRWLNTTNRIVMEQKKVAPGQMAIFGIPLEKNGFVGNFPECFRLINDNEQGNWFGPIVKWNIECLKSTGSNIVAANVNSKYFYHQGSTHNYSNWSGGKYGIAELAEKAKKDNLEFLAITDRAEKLGDRNNIAKYLAEINQINDNQPIKLVAGGEYTMTKYAGKSFAMNESTIKIIGLGYNNLKINDLPDWFPWNEKGKNVTLGELINWHKQHNLPVIISNPLFRGTNGWSAAELIKKNLDFELEKIAGVEFFSDNFDTDIFSLTNLTKIFDQDYELGQLVSIYKTFLAPVGVGISGGNTTNNSSQSEPDKGEIFVDYNRAKTVVITDTNSLTTDQVVEAIDKRRTAATRYFDTFCWIKINDEEWAPGNWEKTIETGKKVKIEEQIQFQKNSTNSQNQEKCVYIIRNNQLIYKKPIKLTTNNWLDFVYVDTCQKEGKYSYILAISGMEKNGKDQEKIMTSPIYVRAKDQDQTENPMETVNDRQKEMVIFTPTIHLGDSFYEGEINRGFRREKAEGITTVKVFNLQTEDLINLTGCQLSMTVCGAQIDKKSGQANPILLNNVKIGECLIPGEDPKKNNFTYTYNIPLENLQIGNNELFIRSLPHAYALRNGQTFIDFDDFEMRDLKIIFCYDSQAKHKLPDQTKSLAAKKIPLKEESEKLDLVNNDDLADFAKEAEKITNDFGKKGGQFIAENDPRYQKFLELVKPINDNPDQWSRQTPIKWKLFESNTLDPIALPDRTILVPTGLLSNEKELPDNKIFPIVSAIWQSDLGLSHKQANRKDLAGVLGVLGTILSKNNNTIAKYVGMGCLLAGSLSLKSEDEDFYIADAYAVDWMKKNGLSVDQAYTILDTSSRLEKNSSTNEYYILAPPAEKRLKALSNYLYYQKTYPVPVSPEMIDWKKVVEEKTKDKN